MQPPPAHRPAPEQASAQPDALVTADDMQVQVGSRLIPWDEFWRLMDEHADAVSSQPAPRLELRTGALEDADSRLVAKLPNWGAL
jgi:hypothetical protein